MKLLLGIGLPLVIAYWVTLEWIWDSWMHDESYYSHGPLLPLLAAYVVWSRREKLAALPSSMDLRGWWLLGIGLLLHLGGAGLMVDSLSAVSLWFSIPGAVLLAVGKPRFVALLAVFGLLLFAVPPPMFVTGKVVFLLKEFAVDLGLGLGNLLGAEATRSGANIRVPNDPTPLVVADACGGLRSLVSLTTVGYVIAFFVGSGRGWAPWIVLVCAVPVAIGSNVVRIASMCLMSRHGSVEFGAGTGHDIANIVVWLGAVGTLIGIDILATRDEGGAS